MDLSDQVAVVTGGGGGIGEGISLCLARAGAHVVVSDLKEELAREVAAKVEQAGKRSLAVRTDVRHEEACRSLIETTLERMGRLDILVCSAGTAGTQFMVPSESGAEIENIPLEVWELTVDVNLKGVFLCNRAAAPHLKRQRSGRIINISSDAGRRGGPMLPVYGASKAGVINLSQSIALQLAPYGVTVNSICPGLIWTPLWAEGVDLLVRSRPELANVAPGDLFNLLVQNQIPLKRAQTPEDIGDLVVFLASERASEITGQAINVDGGAQLN
jgi:NAD(P)-dependent dehydrogenase (short-subunit alcohol dehydrogenase family)